MRGFFGVITHGKGSLWVLTPEFGGGDVDGIWLAKEIFEHYVPVEVKPGVKEKARNTKGQKVEVRPKVKGERKKAKSKG